MAQDESTAEQDGEASNMTAEQFGEWVEAMGFKSYVEAAAALHISKEAARSYAKEGRRPVPASIALLCTLLAENKAREAAAALPAAAITMPQGAAAAIAPDDATAALAAAYVANVRALRPISGSMLAPSDVAADLATALAATGLVLCNAPAN